MNERIRRLREAILLKPYQLHYRELERPLADEYARRGLPAAERMVERLVTLLAEERPLILPDERIFFTRTIRKIPELFTPQEWQEIRSKHFLHEQGFVCNISPNYAPTIQCGLESRRAEILNVLPGSTPQESAFLTGELRVIDAVEDLAERYRAEARAQGNLEAVEILGRVPHQGARTFHEALQFFRILHFTLWLEGEYHNTIGRFDQYMLPYLTADLESGRLNRVEAFELLEEFFLTFNKDSSLYPGVQQGDNGQSMVLGGSAGGQTGFNLLSELCLEASRELKLIDPKINLRVDKDSPLDLYVKGTLLTREGLGFPQYSNDDVVIPGLIALGYTPEDAANYAVAACWEFIIPGAGMDIPNIGALSYPAVINQVMTEHLESAENFEQFLAAVRQEIAAQCRKILASIRGLWIIPAPFMSLLMDGCIERRQDISQGARYNNYGFHGTGLSTAVDSLTAIQTLVFAPASKIITAAGLVRAVESDFAGADELLHRLRYELPKFGDGSDGPAELASFLLNAFADGVKDLRNERGGCVRAGTGSAMYYLWHANEIGASADGRRSKEPFAANYSPSLFARIPGPVSTILSFTRPDLKRVINGGPLTLEFHSTLFNNPDALENVARLVKTFVEMGGHQLQLNAVNREVLLDAQAHPELHRQLIVRVWGWSAYFCELDVEYQNHVLRRQEYTLS